MSARRLEEQTASLNAGLQWSIGENGEILIGKTTPTDLEAFLRLVYLSSAEPGRDSRAFYAARDRLVEQIGPYVRDPEYRFEVSWSSDLFGENPRAAALDPARFKAIDFEVTRTLVLESFADASEFTYVLVGDFDIGEARRLAAKHLGAIPAGSHDEPVWNYPMSPKPGNRRVDFSYSREQRASVRLVWAAPSSWSWQREATLDLMAQAMNNRLLDALREDLGATYVVSTKAAYTDIPLGQYSFIVQFDTDPARVDELIAEVKAEVAKLAAGTFDARYVSQIHTAAQRDYDGRSRTNDFWVHQLGNVLASGLDLEILERARQSVALANEEAFGTLAAELLVEDNLFVYTMLPE